MEFEGSVGVIGLGIMGLPMAEHILPHVTGRGGELLIPERSSERAAQIVADGAKVCSTAGEIAARAKIILLMVPDLSDVFDVLWDADGLLNGIPEGERRLVIVGSTVTADGIRDLQRVLVGMPGEPVHLVDAPVSGGEEGARAGKLSVMVGAAPADARAAWSLLSSYGVPRLLGPVGAGQIAKACNQLIVAATVAAIGEATILGERAGLDLASMFELLSGGYAGSRVLETRAHRFLEDDFQPGGPAKYMVKDLAAATDAARTLGAPTPLLSSLRGLFEEVVAQGHGDSDISVVKRAIAQRATSVKPSTP